MTANVNLSRARSAITTLKRDEAAEKKALGALDVKEQKLVDQFVAAPSRALATQVFALGVRKGALEATDGARIAADQRAAKPLLARAASAMGRPELNADRALLGLSPVKAPPAHAPKPPSPKPAQPWKPGPGHLFGADTSHYQSDATFQQSLRGARFSSIKATEGTGYVDPTFKKRWAELGTAITKGSMKLRIAYHFMTPGNGKAQAQFFMKELGIHGKLAPGTRLALDWEASALKDPKALHDAATEIHRVTGLWPLVYTSGSQVARAKQAVPAAPLWEAKWGGAVPSNVPFVQYNDGPSYDRDVFNGTLSALETFAGW
jgi:GH25 family lysozyme M1 (1,4-beta-N-acetylmuramidase)